MSDTPRTDAIRLPVGGDLRDLCRELERSLSEAVIARDKADAYAAGLRDLLVKTILSLSPHYQGSADKLEDALDRVDAMVGRGPYARAEATK